MLRLIRDGRWRGLALLGALGLVRGQAAPPFRDPAALTLPQPGALALIILTSNLVEVTRINTKPPAPAPVPNWDWVDAQGGLHLPPANELEVRVGGRLVAVGGLGFKRRVLYAPLRRRDLRLRNALYLRLDGAIAAGETVTVRNPAGRLWSATLSLSAVADPLRLSPALHVNQVGYLTDGPKEAMVGYYLGSLGELEVPFPQRFELVEAASGQVVAHGPLIPRPDHGFPYHCYQQVLEADFTTCRTPGQYRLLVPGLGASFPFFIGDGVAAAFARTYALGLYHQRCGTNNVLPFTRFTHAPCHTAPAEVPTPAFAAVQHFLAEATADSANNPRQTAPRLDRVEASLYPFRRQGRVDVAGGHHDAGDYSKYTINSAAFIHYLVFAVDVFPGVAALDNLGLPESGDGKSDLLQEAKWEADFLAKLQDTDGGFYFLVYPRNRAYEQDVLPDHGDPQVVWPKNTAATAAAVAALAQCASSPCFRRQFPAATRRYLEAARAGWAFLQRALARYGPEGAYQKITHYGNDFMHDDELVWAACEMFLATGDPAAHRQLLLWFTPASPATRKWGWWRLYEGYGCAARSYAFAARSGRAPRAALDLDLLLACEHEIVAGADDQWRRARDSAYGTSFPLETKRVRGAGWYFSTDRAFDLAVGCCLDYPPRNDPRPRYLAALLSNLNYEAGCNPVNVCYLTGLGWRRQREIVSQYAENDRRVLPPSGLPVGNLQSGFGWLDLYKRELGALSYPPDGALHAPYPLYDRWGDSFNLQTEYVIVNQARSLATAAFLMARTDRRDQPWRAAPATILGLPPVAPLGQPVQATVQLPGLDLHDARIVWEARDQEPALDSTFTFRPARPGTQWVEVEVQLPDGRRGFAATNFLARPAR